MVRDARKQLGKDNDSYLQSGISLLWTGDTEDESLSAENLDLENVLFPSSLQHGGANAQKLSVDALALSLVRTRKEVLEQRRTVRKDLMDRFVPVLAYLLSIPEIFLFCYYDPTTNAPTKPMSFWSRCKLR